MVQKRVDSWKNAERYHCACCNVWMGSDRQSIQIHENGKKHRENMEASLLKRREVKLREEKDAQDMASIKKMMEATAAGVHAADVASGSFSHSQVSRFTVHSSASCVPVPDICANNKKQTPQQQQSQGELKSWQHRKEKRKQVKSHVDDNNIDQDEKPKKMRIDIKPDEGHYKKNGITYLEGFIFATIFEEDMPIQIWTGSSTMTSEYRKSDEAQNMWKDGIILRIHKKADFDDSNAEKGNACDRKVINIVCDISYLNKLNDEDETIEKKVVSERLRLILGADDIIPATIEEARLSLMGGEEIIEMDTGTKVEIDENTGLSGWGTVSVRKVTVSQEVKEERFKERAKRKEELERRRSKERDDEARKMEEVKHSNADDSALGAYDIWSTSGKSGYKGIQIHTDPKVDLSDVAKSLAKGKTDVKFKKAGGSKNSMFKKAKKKQNRRKTFADE